MSSCEHIKTKVNVISSDGADTEMHEWNTEMYELDI